MDTTSIHTPVAPVPAIELSSSLAEAVVLLTLQGQKDNGPSIFERQYHREADGLYDLPDREKAPAFDELHQRLFRRWGYAQPIEESLAGAEALLHKIRRIAVAREEGSEGCFLSQDNKDLLILLKPERFFDPAALKKFLKSELLHLDDMLDPDFGYLYESRLDQKYGIPEALIRERYRLFWNISIDARLLVKGEDALEPDSHRLTELQKLYPHLAKESCETLLEAMRNIPRPAHHEILRWAVAPQQLLKKLLPNSVPDARPVPGSQCPLCRFPTYQWKTAPGEPIVVKVRQDFPHWDPELGMCERCYELYETLSDPVSMAVQLQSEPR